MNVNTMWRPHSGRIAEVGYNAFIPLYYAKHRQKTYRVLYVRLQISFMKLLNKFRFSLEHNGTSICDLHCSNATTSLHGHD